jgi:hypothetical protein
VKARFVRGLQIRGRGIAGGTVATMHIASVHLSGRIVSSHFGVERRQASESTCGATTCRDVSKRRPPPRGWKIGFGSVPSGLRVGSIRSRVGERCKLHATQYDQDPQNQRDPQDPQWQLSERDYPQVTLIWALSFVHYDFPR